MHLLTYGKARLSRCVSDNPRLSIKETLDFGKSDHPPVDLSFAASFIFTR